MKNAREFAKIGLTRYPEEDFSDDGNRFKGYIYRGLVLSYLYYDGEMYLAARPENGDNGEVIGYYDYCDADWYKLCDKYNGVTMSDIDVYDVKATLDTIVEGIETLKAEIALAPTPDLTEYYAQKDLEISQINAILEAVRDGFDWVNATSRERDDVFYAVDSLKRTRDCLKVLDPINTDALTQRRIAKRFKTMNYILFNENDDYRLKTFKDIKA